MSGGERRREAPAMTGPVPVSDALPEAPVAPQAPKVLVVTEMPFGDDKPAQRRYDANQADASPYGQLHLLRKGAVVAQYQSNAWLSVREEGAIVSDVPADKRKLAIALDALTAISRTSDANFAIERAEQALDDIAELDL